MTTFLLISNVIQWLLLLGMGFLLVGTLRSLGVLSWQFEELEVSRPVRKGREGLKPGTVAPDFELPDLFGQTQGLADYRGKRRLIVFVQPGCGPCHTIVPELNKIQQPGEIQVIGILNADEEAARQWGEETAATFPLLRQEQWSVAKAYKSFATPYGYLIDEEGKVASRGLIGSSQYLQYVLSGAGNTDKSHQKEEDTPSSVATTVGTRKPCLRPMSRDMQSV
ncbi:MAG: TlpA family protein disulfide reductase [Planctomycetaceae bacterium]|nr:TlpA family protein disulfide reductase [Planctomycetaceae bacterium]